MSRPIPNLHRKTGVVSNTQSTPGPAPKRATAARGPDPALSTASVERPIKRTGSLKETAQRLQASVSKKVGAFKPAPKPLEAADMGPERRWDGRTRVCSEDFDRRTHKKEGSDNSSMRTIVPASSFTTQPAPSSRTTTPPPSSATLRGYGNEGGSDQTPSINSYPCEYAPRSLSPVFSESIASDAPLISAFASEEMQSVLSSARSVDDALAGRIFKDAAMRWSTAMSLQSAAAYFEEQAGLAPSKVDGSGFTEEEAQTRESSVVLPAPTSPKTKREGSAISKASSTVEYYALASSEMAGSRNGSVKGELELVSIETKGSSVASSKPLSAVPRHLKTTRRRKYSEPLTPDDSASQFSYSTTSSRSRTTKSSGSPMPTKPPLKHKAALSNLAKRDQDEMQSFKDARNQLEVDAFSSSSSVASYRTAQSSVSSSTQSYTRRRTAAGSRSSTSTTTASTLTSTSFGSILTPHAADFPVVPRGISEQAYRSINELQRELIMRGVDLDVESFYRGRYKAALTDQLQTALDTALAQTMFTVGHAIEASRLRRDSARGGSQH